MDIPTILPGAGALTRFDNPQRGVLLIHGFLGTPAEMKYLAGRLSEAGFSVSVPRIPGHGTRLEELARTSSRDWICAAREAYIEMAGHCREVNVAGLSMGGVLALLLAAEFPVPRIALMSVPRTIADKSVYLAPIAGRFVKIVRRPNPDRGVLCEEARSRHVCYDSGIPVRQSWQLFRMIRRAMTVLPRVRADALVVQSRMDGVIPPDSADYIVKRLGSVHKEAAFIAESGHAVTVDREKEKVADMVVAFMEPQRRLSPP